MIDHDPYSPGNMAEFVEKYGVCAGFMYFSFQHKIEVPMNRDTYPLLNSGTILERGDISVARFDPQKISNSIGGAIDWLNNQYNTEGKRAGVFYKNIYRELNPQNALIKALAGNRIIDLLFDKLRTEGFSGIALVGVGSVANGLNATDLDILIKCASRQRREETERLKDILALNRKYLNESAEEHDFAEVEIFGL